MKKVNFIVALFAAMIFTVSAANTAFAGRQDFTLINQTGRSIVNIYITPSNTYYWDDDILDIDILDDDGYVNITFSRSETARYWDMMAVFSDGNTWIWEDIDLFSVSSMTLRFNGILIQD